MSVYIESFEIKTDMDGILSRASDFCATARKKISTELLKDANRYCRFDTGALKESAILHSDLASGELKWTTDYAREVYYTGTPSKDKNPEARLQWAEYAATKNQSKYKKMAEALI